jgi:hypothetical protein
LDHGSIVGEVEVLRGTLSNAAALNEPNFRRNHINIIYRLRPFSTHILIANFYRWRIYLNRDPCPIHGGHQQGCQQSNGKAKAGGACNQPSPMDEDSDEGWEIKDIRGGISAVAASSFCGCRRKPLDWPLSVIWYRQVCVHRALPRLVSRRSIRVPE